MVYTQENRLIAIDTPLGKDVLLLAGFFSQLNRYGGRSILGAVRVWMLFR
jgi:hypothetical protein